VNRVTQIDILIPDFHGPLPGEASSMKLHHVIESQQFSLPVLQELFDTAHRMEKVVARGGTRDYSGRIMASLFYEPSTRTRFSFESAMIRLGGCCISTENAREFSSVSKGETLEDSIRVINGYADVIVMRHNEVGAAKRAAAVSQIPVINAGDGIGQHPTQALLDIYTIRKELGNIDGLNIAMVGDLSQGRTVRSLAYLLSKFERIKIYFVAPAALKMKQDILDHLEEHNVWYAEETDLSKVAPEVDVIYQTRIQKERFADRIEDYEKSRGIYIINKHVLSLMKERAILMHPLPRVDEITTDVDSDPRAAYFRQAQNGLFVRMALLSMVLS
jgi:aspartate carbamoyltransferase catalytic subunit